jgi:hypothetical protein
MNIIIKYPFFAVVEAELFIIMVEGFRGIRVPFNEAGMGKSRRRYSQSKPAATRENLQGLHRVMLYDTGGTVNESRRGAMR